MPGILLVFPMVGHVALVFGLYILLFHRRLTLYKAGEVKMDTFTIIRGNEPEESAKVARNLINQFELPVLFHIACVVAMVIDKWIVAHFILAVLFIASRYWHSYHHVGSNVVRQRGTIFLIGFLCVAAMWALLSLLVLVALV